MTQWEAGNGEAGEDGEGGEEEDVEEEGVVPDSSCIMSFVFEKRCFQVGW